MQDFLVRTAQNPWGQSVLIGVSWDLMWTALAVGALFAIGHAIWKWKLFPSQWYESKTSGAPPVGPEEKVKKYSATARGFHWIMAASMIVLLVTAFFPVLGVKFPWVTIHWIAGLVLIAAILFHIVHSTVFLDFWSMWVDRVDFRNLKLLGKRIFGVGSELLSKEGKYALPNKLFHHGTALFGLLAIGTGIVMTFRVDTPMWTRNPYLFSDQTWGWIYVLHGVAAVMFITMVMAHIYFAIRPEKLWMTRSMLLGWIRGKDFVAHHDPDRWRVGEPEPRRPRPTGAPSPAGAEAAD